MKVMTIGFLAGFSLLASLSCLAIGANNNVATESPLFTRSLEQAKLDLAGTAGDSIGDVINFL